MFFFLHEKLSSFCLYHQFEDTLYRNLKTIYMKYMYIYRELCKLYILFSQVSKWKNKIRFQHRLSCLSYCIQNIFKYAVKLIKILEQSLGATFSCISYFYQIHIFKYIVLWYLLHKIIHKSSCKFDNSCRPMINY